MTHAQTKVHTESPVECYFQAYEEEGVILVKSTADADRDPLAIVKDFLMRFNGKITASALHAKEGTVASPIGWECPKQDCIRQSDHKEFHLDKFGQQFGIAEFKCAADGCQLPNFHTGRHMNVRQEEFGGD